MRCDTPAKPAAKKKPAAKEPTQAELKLLQRIVRAMFLGPEGRIFPKTNAEHKAASSLEAAGAVKRVKSNGGYYLLSTELGQELLAKHGHKLPAHNPAAPTKSGGPDFEKAQQLARKLTRDNPHGYKYVANARRKYIAIDRDQAAIHAAVGDEVELVDLIVFAEDSCTVVVRVYPVGELDLLRQ